MWLLLALAEEYQPSCVEGCVARKMTHYDWMVSFGSLCIQLPINNYVAFEN